RLSRLSLLNSGARYRPLPHFDLDRQDVVDKGVPAVRVALGGLYAAPSVPRPDHQRVYGPAFSATCQGYPHSRQSYFTALSRSLASALVVPPSVLPSTFATSDSPVQAAPCTR